MKIYENILKGRVKYPPYIHNDAQDLLQRLITADLTKRLGNLHGGSEEVKRHAWFAEVTWERLARKDIDAPYIPPVKAGMGDASQFERYPEETEEYGHTGHDEYCSSNRNIIIYKLISLDTVTTLQIFKMVLSILESTTSPKHVIHPCPFLCFPRCPVIV